MTRYIGSGTSLNIGKFYANTLSYRSIEYELAKHTTSYEQAV